MGRLKILGTFALLGFLGGVLANVFYNTFWPWLISVFPIVLSAEWVISGLAGALITTCLVVVWAYLSRSPG